MRDVAIAVRAARDVGHFPIVLSGNCNSAVGALSGLTPARRAIFWFDAHRDCNTPETTVTGFLDGMGLATALGLCWHQLASSVPGYEPVQPEVTFLLGARDLNEPEGGADNRISDHADISHPNRVRFKRSIGEIAARGCSRLPSFGS
jgi:arginase family enzyme